MRPNEAVFSHKGWHEDPFLDHLVPLSFLICKVPVVVSGDHYGPVLVGVVQDKGVVVAGDDLVVEEPAGGVDQVFLHFQPLQLLSVRAFLISTFLLRQESHHLGVSSLQEEIHDDGDAPHTELFTTVRHGNVTPVYDDGSQASFLSTFDMGVYSGKKRS